MNGFCVMDTKTNESNATIDFPCVGEQLEMLIKQTERLIGEVARLGAVMANREYELPRYEGVGLTSTIAWATETASKIAGALAEINGFVR